MHNKDKGQRYRRLLKRIFTDVDETQLDRIFEIAQLKEIRMGQYLFRQGEVDQVFYLVLSGRLRAIRESPSGQHILGDIAEGEPVGEFALFTQEERTASVLAIRDAVVLELDTSDYDELVRSFPDFGRTLTRFIIDRLRRNQFEQHLHQIPRNIAVIQLDPDEDISPWTSGITNTFEVMNIPIRTYGPENAGQRSAEFFRSIEDLDGINILVCTAEEMDWSMQGKMPRNNVKPEDRCVQYVHMLFSSKMPG